MAEFIDIGGVIVSKCPRTMTAQQAEDAVNSGYAYYDKRRDLGYPSRIYAVIDGVVYRATPTNPGISYHGFPELPQKLAPYRELHDALLELARRDGSEEEVKRWLRECRKA